MFRVMGELDRVKMITSPVPPPFTDGDTHSESLVYRLKRSTNLSVSGAESNKGKKLCTAVQAESKGLFGRLRTDCKRMGYTVL